MGSQRVRQDWTTDTFTFRCTEEGRVLHSSWSAGLKDRIAVPLSKRQRVYIGLAKKFIRFCLKIMWKNPKELFWPIQYLHKSSHFSAGALGWAYSNSWEWQARHCCSCICVCFFELHSSRCVIQDSTKPDEGTHLWGACLSASAHLAQQTLVSNIWIASIQSLHSLTKPVVKKWSLWGSVLETQWWIRQSPQNRSSWHLHSYDKRPNIFLR